MVRRCPTQRKKTTPICCSTRIKKLNLRPKLDVVFQNFPAVKHAQSSISSTDTTELHVQSSKSFGNNDVQLRSEIQNSTFTPLTNAGMKKGKLEEEVIHPLTIADDPSKEPPSLSKITHDPSRTEESQKQMQEKSAIDHFENHRDDLESPVLFDDNANSLIGQSIRSENCFIPSSSNAKKRTGRPPTKLSAVIPSVNDENHRHNSESPVLFEDNANSLVEKSVLSTENCLIPSVNAKKKRGRPSKKQSAALSSDVEDSIPLSKLLDYAGSSLSKNSSKLILSSAKANDKKKKAQEKQSTVSSIVIQNDDLKSSAFIGNNAPDGSSCSKSFPRVMKKIAKKGTRPRKKPGIFSLVNDCNVNAPEYLDNSNSMRPPFSKICTNSKFPLMNAKAKKEKRLLNIFKKDGPESFLGGVELLSIRGQTKTKKKEEKNKSLIVETQNFQSRSRKMESKKAQNVWFQGDGEGEEKKTNDETSSGKCQSTSSYAFPERQSSSRWVTEPVDDLCSLFNNIKLQSKSSQVKKMDDKNSNPKSTRPTTTRYEPRSGTDCNFCRSINFPYHDRSLASSTARYSNDVSFFGTNATDNLYDVNSSPDLNLDIDKVLKSITRIQVRVPSYEPYVEGECWWEGFDEWSFP